jgi:hypothetical protein
MRHIIRHRPSPAMAVALLAPLVALGGIAVASIPGRGGVISACYQKNGGGLRVIDTAKHRNAGKCGKSEKRLAWNQQGVQGVKGDAGAMGTSGATGQPGAPGRSALTALQPGESEGGAWGLSSYASSGTQIFLSAQTFPIPLAAPLDANHVVYVASGATATHCSGAGHADSGYLCVYEFGLSDVVPGYAPPIQSPRGADLSAAGNNGGAERNGFLVVLVSQMPGSTQGWGTWTVTR